MAATVVQSNIGAQNTGLATVAATLSSPATAGNVLLLTVGADDYRTAGGIPSGFNESTGCKQETFLGHYLWWGIATAGQTTASYTIGSASPSCWAIAEISGLDVSPYDISNGQLTATSGSTYTTQAITPTAGERFLIACMGGSLGTTGLTDLNTWLNSFTEIRDVFTTLASGTRDLVGFASGTVTANGSTSYSSGATYNTSAQSRTAMILAFKVAAGGATTLAIAGVATSTTSAAGAVTATLTIAATAATTSTATGALSIVTPVAGAGATTTTASGNLTVVTGAATLAIAGTAASTTTAVGAVGVYTPIAGAATSTTTATGNVTLASGPITWSIAGAATSTTTAAGAVTLRGALTGGATSTTTATGTLTLRAVISGTATTTTSATGGVGIFKALGGVAASLTAAVGDVTVIVAPRIIIRPNTGTTSRPSTGTITRPYTGIVSRP